MTKIIDAEVARTVVRRGRYLCFVMCFSFVRMGGVVGLTRGSSGPVSAGGFEDQVEQWGRSRGNRQ